MKPKILCTIDGVAPEAVKILESIGPLTQLVPQQEELADLMSEVEIVVVQLGLRIDKSVIAAAPKLRMIATATTGLDHIDLRFAQKRRIEIVSMQGETAFLKSVTATAELALGLLLALIRKIPSAHASVTSGEWDRPRFIGQSLAGKTLGIIGYGRLGPMMGKFGKALGMKVIFNDPNKKGSTILAKLLKTADVISLHVPLNKLTEGMIGARQIRLMKPSAILINTSRGKIVNEDAILAALKAKKLGGYATDVLADDVNFTPTTANADLIDYAKENDTVIITPHIGGTTVEARKATDVFLAEKVREFFK